MKKVKMLNSPLRYWGGKRYLRETIISMFPTDYKAYTEVFAGGLWVLFGKPISTYEIVNDIYKDLVNFWQVCQVAPDELKESINQDLVARYFFHLYKRKLKTERETLSNVDRAKMFYYVLKTSFNGQGGHFACNRKPGINLKEIDRIIDEAHERLKGVVIENLDYQTFLERYDKPDVFHYLDPPYHCNGGKRYEYSFVDDDFVKLSLKLHTLRGRFALSINDDLFIRELFRDFRIEVVDTRYSTRKDQGSVKRAKELVILNY